ncbi:MAG: AAA family ATPase [Betaproteobacteria bacterium]|nr:AAA family ATPase [Betaproteobacteria bacterium]MCL2886866.1 AAA family ATPase [Betaproteobacteria bacterium]
MKLTSIHLQNYRAHQDLRVEFNACFNVIAGINGSGKTSLLKGIAETLSGSIFGLPNIPAPIFGEPAYAYVNTVQVEERYRFEPQFPVVVEAKGRALASDFTIEVRKDSDIAPSRTPGGNSPLRDAIHRRENSLAAQKEIILPITAFYRANRQWLAERSQVMAAAMEKSSRYDGYQQWWDAAVNVSALQHWVIGKCLERFQRSSETGKRFYEIDDDELALVNTALSAAIENIGDLRYDMQQKSLLVDWRQTEGEAQKTISFDHLSDGQRALICLVADIARRICLLNPQLGKEVIRQTPGVVLIDELDVHLHPRWQRRIVNGLKAAFPAVQFIAASHSPQILGELQPEEIILLCEGGTSHPQVSYGLDSSQVLKEIMGASARNLDVEKELKQLFVETESNRLAEAKHLLDELRKKAPQIPELDRADALIRRKEVIGR